MQFVVTGGAGFIGSHLVEELLTSNHSVLAIDNLRTGSLLNLPSHPSLRIAERDILDIAASDLCQFGTGISGVVHLAAIPSVQESWSDPLVTHTTNLTTTLRVIEWCREMGIPRLVFASSAAVYGDRRPISRSKRSTPEPVSPYGIQKLASEHYGRVFAAKSAFSFVALRLFNVFGPRQRCDSPYTGVVTRFISAMRDNQPIEIHGNGRQTRDFVYVKDVARAFHLALKCNLKAEPHAVCDIGTGKATSVTGLARTLGPVFGWRSRKIFRPGLPGDIYRSVAHVSEAAALLRFAPAYTLRQGIEELLAKPVVRFDQPQERFVTSQNAR